MGEFLVVAGVDASHRPREACRRETRRGTALAKLVPSRRAAGLGALPCGARAPPRILGYLPFTERHGRSFLRGSKHATGDVREIAPKLGESFPSSGGRDLRCAR